MTNQVINRETINTINTLWAHHIPQRVIAEALDIKYATISMYCRTFKATHEKISAEALIASILDPFAHTNDLTSDREIINSHLASRE